MNDSKNRTVRLIVSESCYDEFQILSIRSKKNIHEVIRDVLEKYTEKKKDKNSVIQE